MYNNNNNNNSPNSTHKIIGTLAPNVMVVYVLDTKLRIVDTTSNNHNKETMPPHNNDNHSNMRQLENATPQPLFLVKMIVSYIVKILEPILLLLLIQDLQNH